MDRKTMMLERRASCPRKRTSLLVQLASYLRVAGQAELFADIPFPVFMTAAQLKTLTGLRKRTSHPIAIVSSSPDGLTAAAARFAHIVSAVAADHRSRRPAGRYSSGTPHAGTPHAGA
jgi:hypothetical protein